jgi:hypothetical protein
MIDHELRIQLSDQTAFVASSDASVSTLDTQQAPCRFQPLSDCRVNTRVRQRSKCDLQRCACSLHNAPEFCKPPARPPHRRPTPADAHEMPALRHSFSIERVTSFQLCSPDMASTKVVPFDLLPSLLEIWAGQLQVEPGASGMQWQATGAHRLDSATRQEQPGHRRGRSQQPACRRSMSMPLPEAGAGRSRRGLNYMLENCPDPYVKAIAVSKSASCARSASVPADALLRRALGMPQRGPPQELVCLGWALINSWLIRGWPGTP